VRAWKAAPSTATSGPELAAIRHAQHRLHYVSVAGRRRREMALTFDDGPGPYTLGLVHELQKLKVPATFFQVGFMIPEFSDAQKALIADRSFVLGDHTENHRSLAHLPAALQYGQINDEAGMQLGHGAPWPHLFRPPYGTFDRTTRRTLNRLHMLMVLWTIDSNDWRQPGVATILRRVVSAARPGAIVLMHDAGGNRSQTLQAVPLIVRALRARHYKLVTVPTLLLDNPPPTKQPPAASGVG
jgi:peptidoglycan/xylan/chitin deacetylase (PgdA/CDA1 family)